MNIIYPAGRADEDEVAASSGASERTPSTTHMMMRHPQHVTLHHPRHMNSCMVFEQDLEHPQRLGGSAPRRQLRMPVQDEVGDRSAVKWRKYLAGGQPGCLRSQGRHVCVITSGPYQCNTDKAACTQAGKEQLTEKYIMVDGDVHKNGGTLVWPSRATWSWSYNWRIADR